MEYVCTGIAKAWGDTHTRKETRGYNGGKQHLYAYLYNEDGKFIRKRISNTEAIKLRLQGFYKRKHFVCQVCGNRFLGLIKHDKDVPDCPRCN